MDWFRKHIRQGARLALLALAIQLGLSFGHVHATAVHTTALTTEAASPSLAELMTSVIDAEQGSSDIAAPSNPLNDHPPAQKPADDCAICAVLALAGTVLFAQPPMLLLPEAIDFLYLTTDAGFLHLDPAHGPFQPRAPPVS